MTLVVRDPANGKTLAEVPEATRKDVEAAVARARAAQPRWSARSLEERARVVRAFQAALLAEREDVARLVTSETGKPLAEALAADVLATLDAAQWCAENGPRLLKPETLKLSNPLLLGRVSRIEREPLGVVGIVSPWNYPLSIPGGQICYALMAGNTVVLKPASYTPLTALRLRELWTKAGLPENAFIVVPGSGSETGDALVNSDVDHLIFTGSVPVGQEVDARLRARGIGSCMELGGSDPALVLDDADIDKVVDGVLWARFTNAGQTCAATKRVFVHRSVHDAFLAKLVKKTQALRMGDPLKPDVDMGPLTDPRSVAEMEAFVADARERGARVLAGGKARPDIGAQYFEPTVLTEVPADARVLREETFGPVLPVVPFDSDDDAIARANDTPFGLSASVWSTNEDRALRVARRIRAGTVVINDAAYTFAANETPWGGIKDSGHGRTHGRWGFDELTRVRHLNVVPSSGIVGSPWWFPYNENLRGMLVRGAAFLYGGAQGKARNVVGVAAKLLRRRN